MRNQQTGKAVAMATTLSFSFTFDLFLLLCASLLCCCYGEHKAFFVFGDSLFDAGNNKYLNRSTVLAAERWPYGETFFKRPTGRLSDGRLVPDFLAKFAKLPFLPPYLQPGTRKWINGVNFASAGAAVLDQNYTGTIDLRTQLSNFKKVKEFFRQKLGDPEANKLLHSAVYLLSIGGNDYFKIHQNNNTSDQSYRRKYVGTVIGNLTSVLQEIYVLGGRKIAFQNAGPLGCTPTMKIDPTLGDSCAQEPCTLAQMHNAALSATLKKLSKRLPGFKYSIFDYYNSLLERINNPSKYGLKEGKSACCGSGPYRGSNCAGGRNGTTSFELCSNPSEYIWFDGGHTTEATNRQLAQLMWSGPSNVTGPVNLKQLFKFV